jgi:hypothetical protein
MVKEWGVPAGLGEAARQTIRGHEMTYYLDRLRERREHTLAELRKRDDALVNANRQPLALGTDEQLLQVVPRVRTRIESQRTDQVDQRPVGQCI